MIYNREKSEKARARLTKLENDLTAAGHYGSNDELFHARMALLAADARIEELEETEAARKLAEIRAVVDNDAFEVGTEHGDFAVVHTGDILDILDRAAAEESAAADPIADPPPPLPAAAAAQALHQKES